jgi:hypothetical protein
MSNYATRKNPTRHDRRCSEVGCEAKSHARGVCQRHYNQFYHAKKGNPPAPRHEGLVRVSVAGWGCLA